MPIPPPAPPVKRYRIVWEREIVPDVEGPWCLWAEIEVLLLQRAQAIAELKAAVTLAMNSLSAIDRSRQAPVDELQRRAVAELRRVITVCREALVASVEK